MSWFTKYVEHPAVNALASLLRHPAVAGNPAVAQAVAEAQAAATAVASSATNAAQQVEAAAAAQADPALQALGSGLMAAADAYLMTLGTPGQVAIQIANPFIAMGEQWAHDYLAGLFAHAKAQAAAPVAPKPAPLAAPTPAGG